MLSLGLSLVAFLAIVTIIVKSGRFLDSLVALEYVQRSVHTFETSWTLSPVVLHMSISDSGINSSSE